MAFELRGRTFTFKAGEDLSEKQYAIVKLATDGTVVTCSAVNDDMLGVVQNNPNVGQAAEVMLTGISRVIAGANLTAGQRVTTTNEGKATPEVEGSYSFGRVLETATAGSVCAVLIGNSVPVLKAATI